MENCCDSVEQKTAPLSIAATLSDRPINWPLECHYGLRWTRRMYGQPHKEFKRLATPSVGMELGLSMSQYCWNLRISRKLLGETLDFLRSNARMSQCLLAQTDKRSRESSCVFKLQRVHWKVSTVFPFDVARLQDHLNLMQHFFEEGRFPHSNPKSESSLLETSK